MTDHDPSTPNAILDRLRALRATDAPTHGGRVLAYVYDAGKPELDELADAAATLARPVNALDPTVFGSVAAMERDVVRFVRRAVHGGPGVVGSVTSGGTESCLLAVKTARDLWRKEYLAARRHGPAAVQRGSQQPATLRPRLVAPVTAHAAFQKAAQLFDLRWDPVPVGPDGQVAASEIIARLGSDVALVVVSAPAYPTGNVDPVTQVASAAQARGIRCHVDACFGGLVLPWLPGTPRWDFRVPGVTSISADLHKFGYAPKGVSVLLHRSRRQHRAQFFATTRWPGYPVVNPTLLGSRSASPLAAAWAIVEHLGDHGFRELAASIGRVARAVRTSVEGIRGLKVMGEPVGPGMTLISDPDVPAEEQVDPHRLADALMRHGWKIQHQPRFTQTDGTHLPRSAHLTFTPVLEPQVKEFCAALAVAADEVRGRPPADARRLASLLRMLGFSAQRLPSPTVAWMLLRLAGAGTVRAHQPMATLMSLMEELPAPLAETLLNELIARVSEVDR